MKVALVKPLARESTTRGAGFYAQNLEKALKKLSGVEITNADPDIVHYLYFDPFFLTLPLVRRQKTVVTVFDLTPIVLANLYPRGIRGEIKWQIQKRILKTVDHVITISKSAKADIVKIIGIPAEKITVTYLAAGKECRKLAIPKDNSILYVGDINPNKNLLTLFKALTLLPDDWLVIVGKAANESLEIKKEIESLGVADRVVLTGFVDEEEKVKLLNKTKVYVQPSIYEGFGLPVLEAMACGTPVICGRNSSLPEIAGDAATYADVTDPNDFAEKIKNVKPTGKEIAQAKKFSWERTARETMAIYQQVLNQ